MPKYKCKDCRAVWYGWGSGEVCPKCGGKLELSLNIPLLKNRSGLRKVELRISHPPTPGTLLLSYKDLNRGPGKSKGGSTNNSG